MELQFRTKELANVAESLGFTSEAFSAVCQSDDIQIVKNRINVLKNDIKQNYKRKALECHPDLYPSKEEEFKNLSAAYAEIEKFLDNLKLVQPKPIITQRIIHFSTFTFTFSCASTTSDVYGWTELL